MSKEIHGFFTMIAAITTVSLLATIGCGSAQKREPSQEMKVVLKDKSGREKALASPADQEAQNQVQEVKQAVASAAQHIQTTHPSSEIPARNAGPIEADKAFGWLKNGNTRFVKAKFRNDGTTAQDRLRIAQGQRPHSVILSCSDSSVPPEIIFDQKLGEVYVVRTAGLSLASNAIGSVEYAVKNLGANLLVVMGHDSCDVIQQAILLKPDELTESTPFNRLLQEIKPRLTQYTAAAASPGHVDESWSNTEGIVKELLERSAILRDAIASGEVKIVKAMYHLESGQVEWR